jgi:hypothetical protein
MAQLTDPVLPDLEVLLKRRDNGTTELGRVAQRVTEMVSEASLSALDAALALAATGTPALAASKRIADDLTARAETIEREVGRAILTAKPV